LTPGAREWWLAGSTSTEPAHAVALEHLDLQPLLDLRLGGDAPSAGLLALPLVTAAAQVLATA
ncbi:MAG: nicotinate-nucleotide--dimethylbenzimidazole phosphoribosyltransferase, partial [Thermocrispum sp.]